MGCVSVELDVRVRVSWFGSLRSLHFGALFHLSSLFLIEHGSRTPTPLNPGGSGFGRVGG